MSDPISIHDDLDEVMQHVELSAETLESMEELRTGGGKSFDTVAELMVDLNADD